MGGAGRTGSRPSQPAFAAGRVAEDNPNCTGCLTSGGELIEGVTFQGATGNLQAHIDLSGPTVRTCECT